MNAVEQLGRQIQETPLPERPLRRPSLGVRSLLVIAGGAVAVVAAVLVLALGATNPPPAYAVTVHGHRTATVTLRDISSLGELNRKMESLHLPIRAVPVVRGCHAKADVVGRTRRPNGPMTMTMNPRDGRVVKFTVVLPRPGRTLILGASKGGFFAEGSGVVKGKIPACVGIDSKPFLIPAG